MKFLPVFLSLCLLAFGGATGTVGAAEPAYFAALGDVPVSPGLSELPGRAYMFDQPEGRIAETAAALRPGTDPGAVRTFYAETLPQMGWMAGPGAGDGAGQSWTRAGERLTLRSEQAGAQDILVFTLEPLAQ